MSHLERRLCGSLVDESVALSILDAAGAFICFTHPNGEVHAASSKLRKLSNSPCFSDLFHPDDVDSLKTIFQAASSPTPPLLQPDLVVENRILVHEGQETDGSPISPSQVLLVRWNVSFDSLRRLIVFVGVLAVIAESRPEPEERVPTPAAMIDKSFQLICPLAPELLYLRTRAGRVIYSNPAWHRVLGWSEEELHVKSMDRLIHPDDVDKTHTALAHFKDGTQILQLRNRYLRKDGTFRWIDWRYQLTSSGIVSVGSDVTDLLADEKKAMMELEAAKSAFRENSAFLANMSHEIRTPMNGVRGCAAMLQHTTLTAEQEEYVHNIVVSADHLLAVINDILDLSKVEHKDTSLDWKPFDLYQCVEQAIDLSHRPESANLRVTYHVDPHVPSHIFGDVTRLRQILTNLLGNALKFVDPPGEIVLRVNTVATNQSIGVSSSGDPYETANLELVFSVQDTGCGIPLHLQHRLFKPFSQVENSISRDYGGTGLGLAISHQLASLMHGRMWVESEEAQGSTFFFTIRTEEVDVLARSIPTSLSPAYSLTPYYMRSIPFRGKERHPRVLLVDGCATTCKLLCDTLSSWGFETYAVDSMAASLQFLQDHTKRNLNFRIDLLVVDAESTLDEDKPYASPPIPDSFGSPTIRHHRHPLTVIEAPRSTLPHTELSSSLVSHSVSDNASHAFQWLKSTASLDSETDSPSGLPVNALHAFHVLEGAEFTPSLDAHPPADSSPVPTAVLTPSPVRPHLDSISEVVIALDVPSSSDASNSEPFSNTFGSPESSPPQADTPLPLHDQVLELFHSICPAIRVIYLGTDRRAPLSPQQAGRARSVSEEQCRSKTCAGCNHGKEEAPFSLRPYLPLRSFSATQAHAQKQAADTQGLDSGSPIVHISSPLHGAIFSYRFVPREQVFSIRSPLKLTKLYEYLLATFTPLAAHSSTDVRDDPGTFLWDSITKEQNQNADISILIAEDNAINRKLLQRVLEKLGYCNVVCASDGAAAVAMAKQKHYQLVLMDVQMPELDGLEATKLIRHFYVDHSTRRRTPIIVAMTANAMRGDRERCLAAGMDDYITKPIDINAVADKLHFWTKRILGCK
jgi:PAS domain S-box-containing protein